VSKGVHNIAQTRITIYGHCAKVHCLIRKHTNYRTWYNVCNQSVSSVTPTCPPAALQLRYGSYYVLKGFDHRGMLRFESRMCYCIAWLWWTIESSMQHMPNCLSELNSANYWIWNTVSADHSRSYIHISLHHLPVSLYIAH
jgi:hypothetical protein